MSLPLEIKQGATDIMQFKFVKDGAALDITDIKFVGEIKASIYDDQGFPFRFHKIDQHTLNVYLDADVSESMDFTKGVYEIKMIQVDGFVSRLVKDSVTIDLGVSDETSYI